MLILSHKVGSFYASFYFFLFLYEIDIDMEQDSVKAININM